MFRSAFLNPLLASTYMYQFWLFPSLSTRAHQVETYSVLIATHSENTCVNSTHQLSYDNESSQDTIHFDPFLNKAQSFCLIQPQF